jgi:hypothetical protein
MPDKITVRINVDQANQTVSKFAIEEGGQVTFRNDAAADATVTFPGGSPLCQGSTPVHSVPVPAGGEKKHKVCDGIDGQQFKYTAAVTGAAEEDPIFIIERKMGGPVSYSTTEILVAGAAVLVAAFVGYTAGKRRSSTPRVSDAG